MLDDILKSKYTEVLEGIAAEPVWPGDDKYSHMFFADSVQCLPFLQPGIHAGRSRNSGMTIQNEFNGIDHLDQSNWHD